MRIVIILISLFSLSCSGKQKSTSSQEIVNVDNKKVYKSAFKTLIDSFDVVGSILVYDLNTDTYFSNDFEWAEKDNLPASTFKIPNSIIGLETGIIKSDSTMFKWDGEDRWSPLWEEDLTFKEAFHLSCVPCYQKLAREIGVERMNNYIRKMNYGQIFVDQNTIDNFWLIGKSRISQMQQISFLRRLYQLKLPISERTAEIMREMMIISKDDGYVLSGKTGLSNENDHHNGWFVGFLELKNNTLFFATNIEPIEGKYHNNFNDKRKGITLSALEELGPFD